MKYRERKLTRAPDANSALEMRPTDNKGDGVFANTDFYAGSTVLVGIIVRELPSNDSRALQVAVDKYALLAGLVSKVNHSCEPNCGVRANATGALDLVAMKSIFKDDEITIDYAMTNLSLIDFPEKCLCGTNLCRGHITGWRDLSDSRKDAYRGLIAPYLLSI